MRPFIVQTAVLVAGLVLSQLAAHHARAAAPVESCVVERDPVSVAGEVHRKRFSANAAPEEEGKPAGRKRTAVILKLRKPLCVMMPDDVNMQPRPRRVHEVQLVSDERLPKSSDKLRHVEGTVVLAYSGHHQLPVLLEVTQVDKAEKSGDEHRHRSLSRAGR